MSHTAIPRCAKHNVDKIKIPSPRFNIAYCPECAKEHDREIAEYEQREKARQTAMEQAEINKRLDNAMLAPRFRHKTFENWRPETPKQKRVKDRLLQLYETLGTAQPTTGAIFCGSWGTGKNHLASAFVNKAIREKQQTALITTAFKIISFVKGSWRRGSGVTEKQVMDSYSTVDVLVIDELGVQFNSDAEAIYLTHIINERYEHYRPTFILSNLPLVAGDGEESITTVLGERIVDRFREGGAVLVFDWESYRGKNARR